MMSRLTSRAAALSIAGFVVLAAPLAASAQEGEPGQGSERCAAVGSGPGNAPGNAPQYPPASGGGVSDSSPSRGQQMNASSGCREFAPGQRVAYGVESVFQQLGTVIATAGGEAVATFTVPTNLADGRHHVVFRGTGITGSPHEVRIPFTVAGGTYTGPGADSGTPPGTGTGGAAPGTGVGTGGGTVNVGGVALPRTGSNELVPFLAVGLGLVTAGASLVIVARRRRESIPTVA